MTRLSARFLPLLLMCALAGLGPGPIAPAPVPTTATPPAAPDPVLGAQIDALVAPYVQAGGPGVAIGVVRNGTVVHRAGYGLADVASGVAITPSTRFDLASVSKQFTAVAVLVLVARGALGLDDDVRTHLPELPVTSPTRPIRVRDLLAMRSGLTDYTDIVDSWDTLRAWTNQNVLELIARAPMAFPTGTMYSYCNTNYTLLALIVERVSGQRFAEFLRANVFEPSGMHATMLLDTPGQIVPERARGYAGGPGGAMPSECDTGVVGDGQVFTTIDDLAIWDDALRRTALLGPELTQLLFTPAPLDSGAYSEYAMGYFLSDYSGHRVAEHSGSWSGTATWMGRFLGDGLTVIVLSNNENLDVSWLGQQVAALALGMPDLGWE